LSRTNADLSTGKIKKIFSLATKGKHWDDNVLLYLGRFLKHPGGICDF
jgi:hypothetical protein